MIGIGSAPESDGNDRPLLVELIRDGEIVGDEPLSAGQERHVRSRAELPLAALKQGEAAIPT